MRDSEGRFKKGVPPEGPQKWKKEKKEEKKRTNKLLLKVTAGRNTVNIHTTATSNHYNFPAFRQRRQQ
jgi:hypothetical protein